MGNIHVYFFPMAADLFISYIFPPPSSLHFLGWALAVVQAHCRGMVERDCG